MVRKKETEPKPRLNSAAVAALVTLHQKGRAEIPLETRAAMLRVQLICYAESWQLTKAGKTIARHLTGRM